MRWVQGRKSGASQVAPIPGNAAQTHVGKPLNACFALYLGSSSAWFYDLTCYKKPLTKYNGLSVKQQV